MSRTATFTRFRSVTDTFGTVAQLPVNELFARLAMRRDFTGAGWSHLEFEGGRRKAGRAIATDLIVLDYDGHESISDIQERFQGRHYVLTTTKSHTDEEHRFRVALALDRTATAAEYKLLLPRLAPYVGNTDPACTGLAQFWFLGSHPEKPFFSRVNQGAALDVDKALALPDSSPRTIQSAPALVTHGSHSGPSAYDRAVAYVAKMPPAISGQGGHVATMAAAVRVARGFALSESETFEILRDRFNDRCQPRWSDRELRHKAKSAFDSNVLPLGYLLEAERESAA